MSVWKGGVWASQKGINAVGPWKGSLWRSERSLTSLGIKKLLFGQGQQGAFYVPKPTVDGKQVLFQDSAGTTPVTADGQPVGYMQDLSGNGHHATQATAAAKPLYRTDGALHWLEFDGVDDYLTASFPWVSMTHTAIAAVRIPVGSDRDLFGSGGTTADHLLLQARTNVANTARAHFWNSAGTLFKVDVAVVEGDIAVLTQRATGTKLQARYNLGSIQETSISGSVVSRRSLLLGSRDGETNKTLKDEFSGAIVVPYAMTDGQLEDSIRYLADLAGITL